MKKQHTYGRIPALAISAIVTALGTAQVQAQESFALEEVIVTATKRAESTQDIPIAVTAISEEQLQSGLITNVRSLVNLTPSLNVNISQSSSAATSLKIRGIGTVGNNAGFESAVGIFLDGAYQPRPGVALSELVDVAGVEVLRGPQGTLFGKNTSAGALSIHTKAPVIGETEGFVSLTAGNYNLVNMKGAYNIDVSDTFAVRVAGSHRARDGVLEGLYGQPDMNDRNRYLARLSALWQPNEDVSLRITADASENDEKCCGTVALTSAGDPATEAAASFPVGGPKPSAFQTGSNAAQDQSEQHGLTVELNASFDNGSTLTYVGSTRDFDSAARSDGDLSVNFDGFRQNSVSEQDVDLVTHEVRFQGLAFDDRLDWMVGAYYSDETITWDIPTTSGSFIDTSINGIAGLLGITPTWTPLADTGVANSFAQDAETQSIFTHNVFDISEDLSFTLGLRYVEEEKQGGLDSSVAIGGASQCPALLGAFAPIAFGPASPFATAAGGALALGCSASTTPAAISPFYGLYEAEVNDSALTWTTSLNYQITDDVMTYITVSEGFKSGGVSMDPTGGGFTVPTFDAEEVRSYELGLKADLADGRVRLNAALFRMDITNYQLMSLAGLSFQVFNVPESDVNGAEIELTTVLTENLVMNLATTYSQPEFAADCGLADVTTASTQVQVNCGQPYVDAPDLSSVLGLNWLVPMGDSLELSLRPAVRYDGEKRPSPADPRITGATTVANFTASLSSSDSDWNVELWANNLTNETVEGRTFPAPAATFLQAPGAYNVTFLSPPRTYGVTARYNF